MRGAETDSHRMSHDKRRRWRQRRVFVMGDQLLTAPTLAL
jgi:hypothetical protein